MSLTLYLLVFFSYTKWPRSSVALRAIYTLLLWDLVLETDSVELGWIRKCGSFLTNPPSSENESKKCLRKDHSVGLERWLST